MRLKTAALVRLREVLQELYPTEGDSRRFAREAGLPSHEIAFHARADLCWWAILQTANAHEQAQAVMDKALAEFAGNAQLQEAVDFALAAGPASGEDLREQMFEAQAGLFRGDASVVWRFAKASSELEDALRARTKQGLVADPTLADDMKWLARWTPEAAQTASIDDTARASKIAARVLLGLGLSNQAGLDELGRSAATAASAEPLRTALKLDRANQRAGLENLLFPPERVVAFLAHGEVEQGHKELTLYASWRLRSTVRGTWREADIPWPEKSPCEGVRLAELTSRLAEVVGAPSSLLAPIQEIDPFSETGKVEWDRGLVPLLELLASESRSFGLRHIVTGPEDTDAALTVHYLERVWKPVARLRKEGVVALSFEVISAAPEGFPLLSRAWRASRRERRARLRMAEAFGTAIRGEGCRATPLPELGCVSEQDLVDWLVRERALPAEAAEKRAREILAASRNGRFELVLARLETAARTRSITDHAA